MRAARGVGAQRLDIQHPVMLAIDEGALARRLSKQQHDDDGAECDGEWLPGRREGDEDLDDRERLIPVGRPLR